MVISSNKQRPTVAFINPPGPAKLYRSIICTYISKANYIWQPQDFINLSAQIPPTYQVIFFDCSAHGIRKEQVFEQIEQEPPVLVILALSSIVFDTDLDFLRDFKQRFSQISCLVLGDILLEKVFWPNVLEFADGLILDSLDSDLAHYIETGESRSASVVLKNNLSQGPHRTPRPKKVSIGIPRHHLFLHRKYRFPFVKSYLYSTVSSQFSCPYRCKYCSASKLPVTYRNHEEVVEEIKQIHKLGIQDIFFSDPSFGFPKENARQIVEGMIAKRMSMRWVCYTNPALLENDFLSRMKQSGCHTVIIGVDDADMNVLKEQYNRTLSESRLIEFCDACHRLKIRVCGDFIIGLKSDDQAVDRMIQLAKRLRLDYASFNIFTVLLGSILREELVRMGTFDPYAIGCETAGVGGVHDKKFIRLRNMAVRKFYARPSYLLSRMLAIRSFSEFIIQCEEMITMFKNVMHSTFKKYV